VIPGAEAAHLAFPPRDGGLAHPAEIRVGQVAAGLDVVQVFRPRVALFQGPRDALRRESIEVLARDLREAPFSHTARDVVEAQVHEFPDFRPHLLLREGGPKEPHAAVDVEADAARRDDPFVEVKGRDAPDGEAVAPMDVRHREGAAYDPGHRGHVDDLLRSLVLAELGDHGLLDEDDPIGPHRGLVGPRDLEGELVQLLQRTLPGL